MVDIAAYADQKDATIRKYPKEKIKELNEKGFLSINAWGKSFKLYKKYFYDRVAYGDIRDKVRVIKDPVLIIHGTEDKDVPFSNSKKIISVLNKKSKFMSIEGADHFFKEKTHREKLIDSIVSWLKQQSQIFLN